MQLMGLAHREADKLEQTLSGCMWRDGSGDDQGDDCVCHLGFEV